MGLLDFGLRSPSPESQPISNQPICKIEVPAFRGLGIRQNQCLKKRLGIKLAIVTQSRLNDLTPTNEIVTIHEN